MINFFSDKNILLIGGTGTVGSNLLKKLLHHNPKVVRVYSRDEYKQFLLQEEMKMSNNVRYLIGDVRDKERLSRAMHDIDIVFNLAAMKHVPASEYNPFEAVKTNVIGTQNVIDCALENKVKKVIYTSSDKAVSPTNTMGATKLLAERLMSSAYNARGDAGTVFASVRFGNVMGSRGSVIPLFKQQIIEQGYVTVTEPEMTRFMMSMDQAVSLTMKACELAKGGEVFVLKMPVMKLKELAEVVIENVCEKNNLKPAAIEIRKIGLRPGEKMFEELLSEDEAHKAVELSDMYIIHSLNIQNTDGNYEENNNRYSSRHDKLLDKAEIKKLLLEAKLL